MKIYIGDSAEGFGIVASNGLTDIASEDIHYERDSGVYKLKDFLEALGFEVEYEEVL